MSLKQFKAESKRLLDLMINSIYTNKEIFLRELISNASDAIDKLHFISLTDSAASRTFEICVDIDKDARTLSISDNGIGMTATEMEKNLGTIAKSGTSEYRTESKSAGNDTEGLIGQFGVGFYSAFMVAEEVTVISRKYGEDCAATWRSSGAGGYEMSEAERAVSGTTVTLRLKADSDEFKYSDFLDGYTVRGLIKRYSDYIRFPIMMLAEKKDEAEGADEYESVNSMIPIWKKNKKDVESGEYESFYSEKFHDYEPPIKVISTRVEGNSDYSALLFIPSRPPYDFYTKSYRRGLQLYSCGVLIMENCEKLLPDYLGFVRGVVDTSDLSLNISREMLQSDRRLVDIAKSLEKKILSELAKCLKDERETYEKIFSAFGMTIKFGAYEGFGVKTQELKDLLIFTACGKDKPITLSEYVSEMPEGQKHIYYAAGSDINTLSALPQVEAVRAKGYNVLLLTDNIDEFVVKIMDAYDGKRFKSVAAEDLDIQSDEERKAEKEKQDAAKELLDGVQAALGGRAEEVKLNGLLGEFPSGLSAKGELSIEMAKVLSAMPGNEKVRAKYVLELNPSHRLYAQLEELFTSNKERFGRLAVLLMSEAMMTVGIMPENPSEFIRLVNEFI